MGRAKKQKKNNGNVKFNAHWSLWVIARKNELRLLKKGHFFVYEKYDWLVG